MNYVTKVLMYPDGKFVDIDQASGGYPYRVDSVLRAKFWDKEDELERYLQMFGNDNLSVHNVCIRVD